MGVASLILGIIVFLLSWIPIVGIPIGIVGAIAVIIMGAVGLAFGQRGAAIGGLVLGVISLMLKLIPGVNLL